MPAGVRSVGTVVGLAGSATAAYIALPRVVDALRRSV